MEPQSLTTAFSVWAAVVFLIGGAIVWELARLRSELRSMSSQLNEYIIGMERRVTSIETYLQAHGFHPPKARKHDDATESLGW